jgi:hypothetical protein
MAREAPDCVFRRNLPLFALIGMSITFAELLRGSTPALQLFLESLSVPFPVGLHGMGVLLIREGSLRWRLPWPSILALGAGYGIVGEAFATRKFFDPTQIGVLGVYGHWAGVNRVWAVQLTSFHAVFSIALPILVLPLLFPAVQGVRLVSDRGMGWAAIVFLTVRAIGTPQRSPNR